MPDLRLGDHAIVIGGSIAGLISARILTDYFARVTIIERDRLPEAPEFRQGAPHARHPHVLLARGQQILAELFPGLVDELLTAGAVAVNMGRELSIFAYGAWTPPFSSSLVTIACSRPLLEHTLYHRVAADPQVAICQQQVVVALATDAQRHRATGVYLRNRRDPAGAEQLLTADFVVDASGRDSNAPAWLAALGYPPPPETTVNAFTGYATRIYRRPAHLSPPWPYITIMPIAPDQPRGGLIVPLEADAGGARWQVTLVGMAQDYPPTDEAGFLAFARSLPSLRLYAAICNAEPLTAPYGYRRAENRLRSYEKLPRYLEGFVVCGDAVYAFNPVYAQGMSVAALGGLTLAESLREQRRRSNGDLTGLAQRFQQQLAKVIAGPWQLATGQDVRWPTTVGGQQPDLLTRLLQRYVDRVLRAMPYSPALTEAFFQVQNMLKPPTALFHPRLLWQVFTASPPQPSPLSFAQEKGTGG